MEAWRKDGSLDDEYMGNGNTDDGYLSWDMTLTQITGSHNDRENFKH